MKYTSIILVTILIITACQGQDRSATSPQLPRPTVGWDKFVEEMSYPEVANRAGFEGTVMVSILVDSLGGLDSIVTREARAAVLKEAVIQTIKRTTWLPASIDGRNMSMWVDVPIVFSLSANREIQPMLKHAQSYRLIQAAFQDSMKRAFHSQPPSFDFRFRIDGKDIPLDSAVCFGLRMSGGDTIEPVRRSGTTLFYNKLVDTVAYAYIRVGEYANEIRLKTEEIPQGATLTFSLERRGAEIAQLVSNYITQAKSLGERLTNETAEVGAVWILECEPRVFGDGAVWRSYDFIPAN